MNRGVLDLIYVRGTQPPTYTRGTRIIAGPVTPWGVAGRPSGYPGPVVFARSSIDLTALGAVPLLLDHEPSRPIGRVTGAIDRPGGLDMAFAISATALGDEALTLVADGVRDGLSVGAIVDNYDLEPSDAGGIDTLVVTAAHLREVSLLPFPAYGTARATRLN